MACFETQDLSSHGLLEAKPRRVGRPQNHSDGGSGTLRFQGQPCLQPGNSRENKGGNTHTAPWTGWSRTSVILTGEESWTGCGRGMGGPADGSKKPLTTAIVGLYKGADSGEIKVQRRSALHGWLGSRRPAPCYVVRANRDSLSCALLSPLTLANAPSPVPACGRKPKRVTGSAPAGSAHPAFPPP